MTTALLAVVAPPPVLANRAAAALFALAALPLVLADTAAAALLAPAALAPVRTGHCRKERARGLLAPKFLICHALCSPRPSPRFTFRPGRRDSPANVAMDMIPPLRSPLRCLPPSSYIVHGRHII